MAEYFIGKKNKREARNGYPLNYFGEVRTFPDGVKFIPKEIKTTIANLQDNYWYLFSANPDKTYPGKKYINHCNDACHELPNELSVFLDGRNWEDFTIESYIAEIARLLDGMNSIKDKERTILEEFSTEFERIKASNAPIITTLQTTVNSLNDPAHGYIKQLNDAIKSAESLKPTIEKSKAILTKLNAAGLVVPEALQRLLTPRAGAGVTTTNEERIEGKSSNLKLSFDNKAFTDKGLIYSEFQIRNFIALLMTHDLIVLSGMSGSGKTQMVKAMAKALRGESRIIPVKPNWTSSEDLVGYFNPMQMAFMPTPFTDAIVEASENPNKIFLICLDEMNIARPEYYFADFLSQLEERTNPQIDLYAESEKDAFLHELNALLGLTQSDDQKGGASETANPTNIDAAWKELPAIDKARIQKRLNNIFRYPPKLAIPENVRFIGTINVDDTTHYLSPKILDRVHVVKFENPLLVTENTKQTTSIQFNEGIEFPQRSDYPKIEAPNTIPENKKQPPKSLFGMLNELNKNLENFKIDFGPRTIRQSLNYHECLSKAGVINKSKQCDITYNSIINQKVLPRLVMDGNIKIDGKTRVEFLTEYFVTVTGWDENVKGKHHSLHIKNICNNAKANHNQINFFA